MVKARKYVVKKYFQGLPKKTDFEIVETELPALKSGEILVKAEFISVDPYLRSFNGINPIPYDQFSYQVGIVQESQDPKYSVGDRVVSHVGWKNYYIFNPSVGNPKDPLSVFYKLPDLKGLPNSLGVGAIGMPGVSAYFGFLEICKPKAGETVVVSGAAGAVGSLVGQIAKIKGCRVIGFAGSDDKVAWLESLGFDKAYNYKTTDIREALQESAPKGVDCYFDNVGGELSSAVISEMNLNGRVSVCGSISAYNEDKTPKASILQPSLVFKQLRIEGFHVVRWADRWMEALTELTKSEAPFVRCAALRRKKYMETVAASVVAATVSIYFFDATQRNGQMGPRSKWIASGQITAKEHVTEGFDNIIDAFVGMLNGENSGKAVVKV